MMLPAPGNADFAVGNAIQPRDKMEQYRDAALVRDGATPHSPHTIVHFCARARGTDRLGTRVQDFYNNGQVQPAPGDIPLAGMPGMDRPLDQTLRLQYQDRLG